MAGQSKWSNLKHIKGVPDVKRGKLFSNLSKEISAVVKTGGRESAFVAMLNATASAGANGLQVICPKFDAPAGLPAQLSL